jgi:hypothetical protein
MAQHVRCILGIRTPAAAARCRSGRQAAWLGPASVLVDGVVQVPILPVLLFASEAPAKCTCRRRPLG